MDETVAYVEGFLTAYSYAAVEAPGADDRPWIGHLKGFAREFQTARLNSGPLPKDLRRIPEAALATRRSANAVVGEVEKVVKDYCDAAGEARRKNLAAWMQHLAQRRDLHDAALKMIYKVATRGRTMPA
jgi:hypothetical protein